MPGALIQVGRVKTELEIARGSSNPKARHELLAALTTYRSGLSESRQRSEASITAAEVQRQGPQKELKKNEDWTLNEIMEQETLRNVHGAR